jgi:hypothetical protein
MNPREFANRWISGMKNLSQEDQVKAFIAGCYGNLFGFAGGIFTMGYYIFAFQQYQWWWSVFILIVAFFTTLIDLVGKKQQLKLYKQDLDTKTQLMEARI